MTRALGSTHQQTGDDVRRAGMLETVDREQRDVRALAPFDRTDVVTPEDLGAATRREPQRLAFAEAAFRARRARHEHRLTDLAEQIARLVGGRTVDAEADPSTFVDERTHRRDARSEPEVRGRTRRDAA